MEPRAIRPHTKIGPFFISAHFKDAKDPCIVHDGVTWHIFGSGGTVVKEEWSILHATAPDIGGPWTEQEPAKLVGLEGMHVAAPSVMYDHRDKLFHMAIQEDFTAPSGGIEYLVSADGKTFSWMKNLLEPISGSAEAGLYDPHFSGIRGEKYLVYAGMPAFMSNDRPFIPQPDIFVAKSQTNLWTGPWNRMQKILDHDEIAWHHNRRQDPDYEWGIEGPQLVELPNGKILLNATCFLPEGRRGTRQRVFFALADNPEGPFKSLGPVLSDRDQEWESGENGHATAWVYRDQLYLFYQARSQKNPDPLANNWQYGLAMFDLKDLM
ncbi:MAG: hypothetical protein JWO00_231 [Candidatus Parcubacteria bacterium]|nr:hypothetical protein [Candidatus Parcubacteria bacterium]